MQKNWNNINLSSQLAMYNALIFIFYTYQEKALPNEICLPSCLDNL